MLDKLHLEFTKSRPRHCNDNALVESKNAAVVRKHLGYTHIPSHHAQAVHAFTRDVLTPYLNFHRPCFFPVITTDAQGRQRRCYPLESMHTPYEKLKSIDAEGRCLKPGITYTDLDHTAIQTSDSQSAEHLNQARQKLFNTIFRTKTA